MVAAFGANLLSLKPCIEVKDGKLVVVKKYRGSYDKCLAAYTKDRLENRDSIETDTGVLVHTDVAQKSIDLVDAAIRQYQNFGVLEEIVAGCTISCHCGPGTLGLVYVRK